jgi:hypothetical protein
MSLSVSRRWLLAAATMAVSVFCVVLYPTLGSAQNARTKAEPAETARRTPPPLPDFRPFGFVRQDLFDRRNPNNLRSDYAPPPAQPGQF